MEGEEQKLYYSSNEGNRGKKEGGAMETSKENGFHRRRAARGL